MNTKIKLLLVAVGLGMNCGNALASATTPCAPDFVANPIQYSKNAKTHVFIARVTDISWSDPLADMKNRADFQYSAGNIKASFKVLQVIKGGIPPFPSLNQMLYGNPDSTPLLQVATDYVIFTNDGTVHQNHCVLSAMRIQFNQDESVATRLRTSQPDRSRPK